MAGAVMEHVNIDSLAIVANMERAFPWAQNSQCTLFTLSILHHTVENVPFYGIRLSLLVINAPPSSLPSFDVAASKNDKTEEETPTGSALLKTKQSYSVPPSLSTSRQTVSCLPGAPA